ncbi:diguanylate cyclase [Sutcliffiella horikoshii]|uniref:GGDEF domain-containing response regulator n=1 Tax=Sutcliffiella horikoshii TaxID=79883 RepID=UPI001EEDE1E1|nr:diguanylate cyclase [Sutcliffiella horikoshii]MCG1023345.1 diguanylate cyclase [Sutcliffiella horikoshii]
MLDKYKTKLIDNIWNQINQWEDSAGDIPHEEVYRFIHSIKGTARTVGLDELGDITEALYEKTDTMVKETWQWKECQSFLQEVIGYCKKMRPATIEQSKDQPSILIADHDASLLMEWKEYLESKSFHVLVSTDIDKSIDTFYDVKPDCLILDDCLKDNAGLHLLERLQASGQQMLTPVMVTSSNPTRKNRLDAYRLGADDFMSKPLDLEEFEVRISRHVGRKKQYDELLLIDELTKAYNRKYFHSFYGKLQANLSRMKETFSVGVLDLDYFKKVNDTYGHVVGDEVLKGLAAYMKHHMRTGDVFARYGGEEFAMLLPKTTKEQAEKLIGRLLEGFMKVTFHAYQASFSCSFSGGVVQITEESLSLEHAMERADKALYEAKRKGKARVEVYEGGQEVVIQKVKVAIVDDDEIVRMMLSEVVGKLSVPANRTLEIETFEDGKSFLQSEWLQSQDRYVIILDGMMPKMDGLEVLQKLRAQRRHDQFKVMMLTSRKSERDIQKALQLGADDYVTKPFKLLEVEARLQHLIKRGM